MGSLYIVSENNVSKIGISKSPKSRVKTVTSDMGFSDPTIFISEDFKSFKDYEKRVHNELSNKRIDGQVSSEVFNISFDDAFDVVMRLEPSKDYDSEFDLVSGSTKVTCDVDRSLFKALDKIGIKSKKEFCEDAISDAIHQKIQDFKEKSKLISDFINFK